MNDEKKPEAVMFGLALAGLVVLLVVRAMIGYFN